MAWSAWGDPSVGRAAFYIAGFGLACWAAIIPTTQTRLAVDEATLGLLLLALGGGSVVAMQAAGPLTMRIGARVLVAIGALGMAVLLPTLAQAADAIALALLLAAFGAFLGLLEVAMNIHAVEVEKVSDRPLMSGFHAQFSIGGFVGAGSVAAALKFDFSGWLALFGAASIMIVALLSAIPGFLPHRRAQSVKGLVLPRGTVVVLSLAAAIFFLVEGAILDWTGVLLSQQGLVAVNSAGVGYAAFAAAMTVGRLCGDRAITRFDERAVFRGGALLAIASFALLLLAPSVPVAILALFAIGLGASNLVPILFRQAGCSRKMQPELAIAAISTIGYAGILIGPALVGLVASLTSLAWAFVGLAGLMFVPLIAVPRSMVLKRRASSRCKD